MCVLEFEVLCFFYQVGLIENDDPCVPSLYKLYMLHIHIMYII